MPAALLEFAELAPLGFVVGLYGTLIGAGGGFLLVPALLLLMPDVDPAAVTSMSLAVVFFNSYSGTLSYVRMRRIDYFAATLLVLAGLPGAVFGPVLAHQIPRAGFEPIFGVVLLAAGVWLAWRPLGDVLGAAAEAGRVARVESSTPQRESSSTQRESSSTQRESRGAVRWGLADSTPATLPQAATGSARPNGYFNTGLAALAGAYIGLLSSVLGIGGGVIQVPFMVRALRFPPHVATATSQLVLAVLALVATLSHLRLGAFHEGVDRTMYLAVGVMMGAPIGALISTRVQGSMIVRLLALALCVAGFRLTFGQIFAR